MTQHAPPTKSTPEIPASAPAPAHRAGLWQPFAAALAKLDVSLAQGGEAALARAVQVIKTVLKKTPAQPPPPDVCINLGRIMALAAMQGAGRELNAELFAFSALAKPPTQSDAAGLSTRAIQAFGIMLLGFAKRGFTDENRFGEHAKFALSLLIHVQVQRPQIAVTAEADPRFQKALHALAAKLMPLSRKLAESGDAALRKAYNETLRTMAAKLREAELRARKLESSKVETRGTKTAEAGVQAAVAHLSSVPPAAPSFEEIPARVTVPEPWAAPPTEAPALAPAPAAMTAPAAASAATVEPAPPPAPEPDDVALEGRLARRLPGYAEQFFAVVSGWALLRFLWRRLPEQVRVRQQALLETHAAGLRITRTISAFGRVIHTLERSVPYQGLDSVGSVRERNGAVLGAGMLALISCTGIGCMLLFDGVQTGRGGLAGLGLAVMALGFVLDTLAYVVYERTGERAGVVVELKGGGRFILRGASAEAVERCVAVLRHRAARFREGPGEGAEAAGE